MRLFRKRGKVCQNCEFGNNKKGKWVKRKIRKNWEQGWWHIFCEKKQKYYAWDKYKRCFKEKGSIRMTDVSYLASEGRNMDYHLDIHHKKGKIN